MSHKYKAPVDPWRNVACIACIAGLFAIRRYLVRRHELKEPAVPSQSQPVYASVPTN